MLRSLIRRLPIRARITAAFAVSMALVLAATGLFVYLRLGSDLTDALDDRLETQAAAAARLLAEGGGSDPEVALSLDDPGETFTQVVGAGERVLASSAGLPERPILDAGSAGGDAETIDSVPIAEPEDDGEVDVEDERMRALAQPVNAGGEPLAVVVAATSEDRDEALETLAAPLLLGLPGALLLASLLGYLAVRGTLAPVERMRRQARLISARRPGERLPVSATDDELARLGRTLNEMLDRLEAGLERERTFVADASHELRTPIAILRAELEVALRGSGSPHELEAAIRSAVEEADRLTTLADALLLLARSDQGALSLQREPLDARDLLEDTAARFAARAAGLDRTVTANAPPGLMIEADRVRLEQALANLVENALRHGEGAVELAAKREGESVVLSVRDHGAGFPAELLAGAFERFTRGQRGRTGEGVGLGLSIVAAIASAHGGSAMARNRDAGGAEVMLRLPALITSADG